MRTAFTGAVLTGGQSTRMGTDKALIDVGGRTLAQIAGDALGDAGAAEVLAIGGDGTALAALGLSPVTDQYPGAGPLGGIATALAVAAHPVVVVLACDLPAVTAAAVQAVLDQLGDADAAIPEVDGRQQVLLAAYRRTCLGALLASLERGELAVHRAVEGLRVQSVELADHTWAINANRPGDLSRGSR